MPLNAPAPARERAVLARPIDPAAPPLGPDLQPLPCRRCDAPPTKEVRAYASPRVVRLAAACDQHVEQIMMALADEASDQ